MKIQPEANEQGCPSEKHSIAANKRFLEGENPNKTNPY